MLILAVFLCRGTRAQSKKSEKNRRARSYQALVAVAVHQVLTRRTDDRLPSTYDQDILGKICIDYRCVVGWEPYMCVMSQKISVVGPVISVCNFSVLCTQIHLYSVYVLCIHSHMYSVNILICTLCI